MPNNLTQTLYGGDVTIHFSPDSHRYRKEGERTYLISVTAATGILDKSRFLIPWAVNLTGSYILQYLDKQSGQKFTPEELRPIVNEALEQHKLAKEKAASIGEKVHDFAENFAKFKAGLITTCPDITDDMEPEVINGINAFLEWFNTNKVKFTSAEKLLYSRKNDYTGLTDAVAIVNGRNLLIDYKTGKGIYNEAHYQVAGYVLAYEEETGEKLDGALILNFNKETGAMNEIRELSKEDIKIDSEIFLHCLAIKKREKELNKFNY